MKYKDKKIYFKILHIIISITVTHSNIMSTFSYIALTKPYMSYFNSHDDSKCALTTGEKTKTNQGELRLFQ